MKLEVDNRTIARFWLILIGFIAGGCLLYWARRGLLLLGMAIFLAMALNPIVAFLAKKFFKGKRVLATAITYLGVVAVVIIMGLLVIPAIVDQTLSLAKTIPDFVTSAVSRLTEFGKQFDRWNLESFGTEIISWVDANKANWVSSVGNSLFAGIGSAVSSIAATFMVLIMSFLILIESPNLTKYVWSFYRRPKLREHHKELFGKMYRVVTGFVGGQLTVAIIGGSMASLLVLAVHLIFGTPISLMAPIGLMTVFLAFIPMIGAALSLILGSLIILIYGWQPALVFAISLLVYQQIEGNVITPSIQARKIEMSTLVVMVAIVIGMYMFGVLGGLIAIPTAGCLKVLIEDYRTRAKISDS